jgi:hypothetical protein
MYIAPMRHLPPFLFLTPFILVTARLHLIASLESPMTSEATSKTPAVVAGEDSENLSPWLNRVCERLKSFQDLGWRNPNQPLLCCFDPNVHCLIPLIVLF